MKEKTKVILLVVGGFFFLTLAIWNYLYFSEKNKEDDLSDVPINAAEGITPSESLEGIAAEQEPKEEIIYKSAQKKFDDMLNALATIKYPSYFNESANNPIHEVNINYPNDSNHYEITVAFIDETTNHHVSYLVTSDKTKYEQAVAMGEKHTMDNGTELYYYDSLYHWKEGDVYANMGSLDFSTTNGETVMKIANTLSTKAKYQPLDVTNYRTGYELLSSTSFVEKDEHVGVSMQYLKTHDISNKPFVQIIQQYKHFTVTESAEVDFTKDGFMSEFDIEEKQINGRLAYYDINTGSVYYNSPDRSIVFLPRSEDILKGDKYYEVLSEMTK